MNKPSIAKLGGNCTLASLILICLLSYTNAYAGFEYLAIHKQLVTQQKAECKDIVKKWKNQTNENEKRTHKIYYNFVCDQKEFLSIIEESESENIQLATLIQEQVYQDSPLQYCKPIDEVLSDSLRLYGKARTSDLILQLNNRLKVITDGLLGKFDDMLDDINENNYGPNSGSVGANLYVATQAKLLATLSHCEIKIKGKTVIPDYSPSRNDYARILEFISKHELPIDMDPIFCSVHYTSNTDADDGLVHHSMVKKTKGIPFTSLKISRKTPSNESIRNCNEHYDRKSKEITLKESREKAERTISSARQEERYERSIDPREIEESYQIFQRLEEQHP